MADEDNVIRVDFGRRSDPIEQPPATPADREKLAVFTELIDKGTVMVTLDARVDGVIVPRDLPDPERLNLNFCHTFGIADFEYDERGVRASLSFKGRDKWCEIPWSAVWMMRSHVENDVMLFPASIPQEMLTFFAAAARDEEE